MSAQPALGARGAVASALTAAADWLVAPADSAALRAAPGAALRERPVVAVVGLAPRCGATTVARALGAELAARDPGGATAVTCSGLGGSVPLGLPAAGRLARTLAPVADGRTRACGRLCLVECPERAALAGAVLYLAPLVLDTGDPEGAPAAAALADRVVLVAGAGTEPSLAAVVSGSLGRIGPEPLIALNRAEAGLEAWEGRAHVQLPESRMGAQLAMAGREPRGEMGAAIAALADRLEQTS